MRNRVVSLNDVVEFTDLDLSGYQGATIVVEAGRFVLVVNDSGDIVDARYSGSVNNDTIDAGASSTVNADSYDAGAS